jgi:GT2 family glycosyltransferase
VRLVVVDAGDDDTAHCVRTKRRQRATVVERRCGIPEARNLGASVATTRWLVFTDADVAFGGGYFDCLDAVLYAADDGARYGPKLSRDGYARTYRALDLGVRIADATGVPAASGSNLVVASRAFAAVGGFDPRLSCNEDTELAFRLKRHGYRVSYDPSIAVYAFDHRRLDGGVARKVAHAVTRCALLYVGVAPDLVRRSDWGYWNDDDARG